MVTQLIYMSEPFGYDSGILSAIRATARRNNARHEITGAPICRDDIYPQLIEGDGGAIDAQFARIVADDRRLAVTLLSRAAVPDRLFPGRAMVHDPARSSLWSPAQVHCAVHEATDEAIERVFARSSAEAASTRSR